MCNKTCGACHQEFVDEDNSPFQTCQQCRKPLTPGTHMSYYGGCTRYQGVKRVRSTVVGSAFLNPGIKKIF